MEGMVFGRRLPVFCQVEAPIMRRRIFKAIRIAAITLIVLFLAVFVAIRHPAVQTWLVAVVTSELSESLGTEVKIDRVEIDLLSRLVLRGVYVADEYNDTLLYVPSVKVRNFSIDRSTRRIDVRHIDLQSPYFRIVRPEGEQALNLAFLINHFTGGASSDSLSEPPTISIRDFRVRNGRFSYLNFNRPEKAEGIDWNHLELKHIHLDVEELISSGDSLTAYLDDFSFSEKRGFVLRNFRSAVTTNDRGVSFRHASITTNNSLIRGDLSFFFSSIDDLEDFEQQVGMMHTLKHSIVELGDIGFFTESLRGIRKTVSVSGRFRGKVSNLRGRDIVLRFDRNSYFRGSFHLDGLPDIDQTFITCDVNELVSNKEELERIPIPPFKEGKMLSLPPNAAKLGQMSFNGNFTGFINDFVAFGNLQTAIGRIHSDLSLREDTGINDFVYKGNFGADEFDLGQFIGDRTLGRITTELQVNGKGLTLDAVDARLNGQILRLDVNDYTLRNIHADGTLRRRFFDGYCRIDDPHLIVDFLGQVNFQGREPELHFTSDIMHMDLKALGLLPDFPYSALSGTIVINSTGIDPDNFDGTISVKDLLYCSSTRDYSMNRLEIKAERGDQSKITLDSDVATGFVIGRFSVYELMPSLEEILADVVPSYKPQVRPHKAQTFSMQLDVVDFSYFSEIFVPQLTIAPETRISLSVDEPTSLIRMTMFSDSIIYEDLRFNGLVVDASRPDKSIYASVLADEVRVGKGVRFPAFAMDAHSEADSIFTDIVWGQTGQIHQGEIKGKFTIRSNQHIEFEFFPGSLRVSEDTWIITGGSSAAYESGRISVPFFELKNGNQKLEINGAVSKDPEDVLSANLAAFDLALFNPFLGDELHLKGKLTGTSSVKDIYGTVISSNDLYLLGFEINEYAIGDVCVETLWDNENRILRLEGDIEKTGIKPLHFAGIYNPSDSYSPLDLNATLNDLDLGFINAFLDKDVLGVRGFASGNINITGTFADPRLEGEALLRDAWVRVPYINCEYQVTQRVVIYPDMFAFNYVRIKDSEGNGGHLIGTLLHNAFGDWSYDMVVEVDKPFLVMNTTSELNSLYYGKAYCTGRISIFGYDGRIEFDVNARTEKGTRFAMPMNSTEEQSFASFIRFIDSSQVPQSEETDLTGIKMNFELDITPDAEFQIIFDEAVGDVMKGRGKGHINMEINNLSTFNMYGSVELVSGDYLFTLKNLLNKEFTVRPGGTISWFGDPFAGDLNLEAIYKVSASLYDLIPDETRQAGQRVPVDLVMKLTGRMFSPQIAFDVNLPTVDEITRSRVASAISTDQERNRQAFSLLVLRRFVTPPNISADRGSAGALAENSTELLSSQISNWLSQISDDFNLGFNYRPGDDISSTEIALALSTQLFNERLSVSGNFGVRQGNETNQNPTNYIGDIRVEYKITKDGKIRLVVYNETNDFRTAATQQAPYTQGVGFLYREEFDTWDQFMCGFRQLFVPSERRKPCI